MAITSISHRVAGVVLFVGIAFGLYAFDLSLSSEAGFESVKAMMTSPLGMLITFGFLAALSYHFVAGIKHLLLDLDVADSLEGGRFAAKTTILISAILILLSALWVFQG